MRVLLAILLATTLPICLVTAQQDHERAAMKRSSELVAQEKYEAAIREYERLSPAAGELYAPAPHQHRPLSLRTLANRSGD